MGKRSTVRKSFYDSAKEKLAGAKFRCLNQLLYSSTSKNAFNHFILNPSDFEHYHIGWNTQQKKGWSVNPAIKVAELIETSILDGKIQAPYIADLGCGEAVIHKFFASRHIDYKILSFDLVSVNPSIATVCDINQKIPIGSEYVNFAVLCLSLMNTNYSGSINEAFRILKRNGTLFIVEIESRFDSFILEIFLEACTSIGFILKRHIIPWHNFFVLIELVKTRDKNINEKYIEFPVLKPCVYKKR